MTSEISQQTRPLATFTALLEEVDTFAYLRMGDGELDFLLKVQDGEGGRVERHPERGSVEVAHCCPGMVVASAGRLLKSYEGANYVDLHTHLEFNQANIARLQWEPRPDQRQGDGFHHAGILQNWTIQEMPRYLSGHRCLFFGPEAGLMRELLQDPDYRRASGEFWSGAQEKYFLEPVGGGLELFRHLDDFKLQITQAIAETQCDTVFISLGGAAKIIGSELARELQVRTIDFGSMMRMLTYSGSAGHASWRASYLPYLFRVPFPVYMGAYERAYPAVRADKLLIKAQSQLCLELQSVGSGRAILSDVICKDSIDLSEEAGQRFCLAYAAYSNWRRRLSWRSLAAIRVALIFEWWTLKKQIEPNGKFLARFRQMLVRNLCLR